MHIHLRIYNPFDISADGGRMVVGALYVIVAFLIVSSRS